MTLKPEDMAVVRRIGEPALARVLGFLSGQPGKASSCAAVREATGLKRWVQVWMAESGDYGFSQFNHPNGGQWIRMDENG